MRLPRTALLAALVAALSLVVLAASAPASASTTASAVAAEIADTGASLDDRADVDDDLRAAVAEANQQGIGVAVLDTDAEAVPLARQVSAELESRRSRYRIALVVTYQGVGAASSTGGADLDQILDGGSPTFDAFARGATAEGVRLFTDAVAAPPQPAGEPADQDDGGGFPWVALLVVLAVVGAGVAGVALVRQSKTRRRAEADRAARHAEIGEQLRDNADRVILLGQAAIDSGRAELIELYERASETYRDVSGRLETAQTVESLDRLDQRLDEAEWQLASIEAQLAGQPAPPRPGTDEGPASAGSATPPAPAGPPPAPGGDGPALAPDESLFGAGRRPGRPPRTGDDR